MLASFEQTTDHLYDAAVHCKKDDITGVSECIITGNLVSLGTGAFKLCHDDSVEPVDFNPHADKAPTCGSEFDGFEIETGPERARTYIFDGVK